MILLKHIRGCSSLGRALEWHSRGKGFDPPHLHHKSPKPLIQCGFGLLYFGSIINVGVSKNRAQKNSRAYLKNPVK